LLKKRERKAKEKKAKERKRASKCNKAQEKMWRKKIDLTKRLRLDFEKSRILIDLTLQRENLKKKYIETEFELFNSFHNEIFPKKRKKLLNPSECPSARKGRSPYAKGSIAKTNKQDKINIRMNSKSKHKRNSRSISRHSSSESTSMRNGDLNSQYDQIAQLLEAFPSSLHLHNKLTNNKRKHYY
jgi:hypothetical protein